MIRYDKYASIVYITTVYISIRHFNRYSDFIIFVFLKVVRKTTYILFHCGIGLFKDLIYTHRIVSNCGTLQLYNSICYFLGFTLFSPECEFEFNILIFCMARIKIGLRPRAHNQKQYDILFHISKMSMEDFSVSVMKEGARFTLSSYLFLLCSFL